MTHTIKAELKIDFKALRAQKFELITLNESAWILRSEHKAIEAVISLIDAIQDQAAEQLSEKTVFGPFESSLP